jgi:hypothetical protein
MRYWDASAIVPLLVHEPRSAEVQAALAEDAGVVTWWGTRIECVSAIARLERAAALTPRQAAEAIELVRVLAGGWHEILPVEPVRETACRLLRVHALRAADAMQLAAATVMAAGRPAEVWFLAFDDRLRLAAGREGFRVGP